MLRKGAIMQNKYLLSAGEAANYLSVSIRTLATWRSIGQPAIPYSKIGRLIRYKKSELDIYIDKNTIMMGGN